MRRRWSLVLGLLAVPLVGCATGGPVGPTSWLEALRPFHGPVGPDVVQMDVALLERPLGDPYLNQRIWALADEQVVALEGKGVLEDNGFRVGQVGGIIPEELKDLLFSERSNVNPRRLVFHADHPTVVKLGGAVPQCTFQVQQDGRALPVALEEAECTLEILPSLAKDGRVRLRFTPQVQYGRAALTRRPADDRSGWELKEERPTERYPALSWDVALAPNEYVLVGARFGAPETLGHQSFIRPDESTPVQRLLVIRTGRSATAPDLEIAPDNEEASAAFGNSPPLALQAAWTTARGSSP